MFDEARAAIATLRSMVRALDPACLAGRDAAELLKLFTAGERVCAAGKTLLAARVADANGWHGDGHKSAAHWLSSTTGESLGAAINTLATGERLAELADTRDAFTSGQLSASQAQVIAEAAAADPGAEQHLLARAPVDSMAGLRDESRRIIAGATDTHEREKRIRRSRYLRTWTDADGAGCGQWRTTADKQALLLSALEAHQREIFDDARRHGRLEPSEAYAVDALVDLCTGRATPQVNVEVTVDAAALHDMPAGDNPRHESGSPSSRGSGGGSCEIPGVGPISVATARRLLGDAFVTLLVRDGLDIKTVCRAGHQPTVAQRRAVFARDRHTCAVPGCAARRRLEIHHIDGWSLTRTTALDRLCLLCNHHHDLCSYRDYRIDGTPGHWQLIPPSPDPGRGPPTGTGPPADLAAVQHELLDAINTVLDARAPARARR
jgi:hypothetical protein